MKPFSVLILPALVIALSAAGCGKGGEETVLAEVGPKTITTGDFQDAYMVMKAEDRPALDTPEAKEKFLDDLVNKEVMERAAAEEFPELTDRQATRLERYTRMQLMETVKNALIRDQIHITKAMKDRVYKDMSHERHLKAMLIPDADAAAYVKKQVEAGGDWATLARDHSMQWVSDIMDGDLGWKKPGFFPYPVDEAVWKADVGTLVGPIQMPLGNYLVQVVDERPADVTASREEMDGPINEMLLEPLYMNRQKEVQDSLLTAAGPYYSAEAKALLMLKYYFPRPEDQADNEMWYLDAPRVRPTFTAKEGSTIVVDFKNDRDWTAEEFADRLTWYPGGLWPRGMSEEQLLDCLEIVMRDYLYLKAAEDKGYNNDAFQKRIDMREKEMRVTFFYYNTLMPKFEPDEKEINDFFVEHRDQYRAARSYKVAFFGSKDADLIQKIRADWKKGVSFGDLRQKYEPGTDLIAVGESEWIYEGQDVVRDDLVATLKEGGVSEVVTRADLSMVLKLIARRPERLLTYSEAKTQVDEDAKTVITDRKLNDFLQQKREEYGVKIHKDALAKIDPSQFTEAA